MQAVQPVPERRPLITFPPLSALRSERLLVGTCIAVAMVAVIVGGLLGPFQAFRRAPALQWQTPIFSYYYQVLTLHGVLNALVFTTFFIVGISFFVTQRSLQRPLASLPAAWVAVILMVIGTVFAGWAMIAGEANVLYTFYPPMLAHPLFYLGLTLVVVGSWVAGGVIFATYLQWRAEHPGERAPLAVFGTIANFIMWITASLGVATEILTMLLPLSLGIIQTTDPQVGRILFWFFGHPLVYFWLLPAYISWYTMMPKLQNVSLFSDTFARISFIMIMIFSIPIGVHHLFVDPGVSETAKLFHAFGTFVVAIPSLLTAFNIAATLEKAGRARGGGLISWAWKQPWLEPAVSGQLAGMLIFIVGGITGIMNASFNMNLALHNTTWVPGHFHTTLGGGVFMTYIAILYWLLPILTGRKLFSKALANAQIYTWFAGILMFGGAMGRAGLEGATRRTDLGAPGAYISDMWVPWLNLSAVAGGILLISLILLILIIVGTLFFSKGQPEDAAPILTTAPKTSPLFLERWSVWIGIIIITNIIMWGPVLLEALNFSNGFWATPYSMR